MTSLRGLSPHRFRVIAFVGVTSLIIVSSCFIETTTAKRTKRVSDESILIDLLKSLIEYEEVTGNSKGGAHFMDSKHQQEINDDREASNKLSRDGSTCGAPAISPNVNTRIVGGIEATPHSWPWQCSLQYNFEHACGCSVTSNSSVIITAAHCVVDNGQIASTSDIQVVCGDHNLLQDTDSQTQIVKVQTIIVHSKYDEPTANDNDIAFLVLRTPLTFSATVSPVCIPSFNVSVGTNCVVTGWGDTKGTGDSNVLRQVVVPIFNQTTCNNAYDRHITNNMVCAGYPAGGKDSCQGDSGGPLVCPSEGKWYLQGIVSFGEGCAEANKPGIYTRVSNYQSMIQSLLINGVAAGSTTTPTGDSSSTTTKRPTTTRPTTKQTTTTTTTPSYDDLDDDAEYYDDYE